ncbi:Hsp70 family protein [Rhodocyclus tenuis]|uniref:Hsp70 family protein n=1 Tax=Rhodocyclus gracilis TaxID=2929842 RepID=UPI001298A04D|nr:Hsp70 family protein [Rhodocyclus gracilis]MRD73035.1 Hsp70 family protein [Rhodocyclus gracilis]
MSHAPSARACGIDFGTSNSTVGCLRPEHPTLLTLEDGKVTLPSVVFFNAEDESTRFGRAGLADYLAGYEGRLMRSLKSLLGSRLIEGKTEVHGRSLLFRDLLAQFIGELKRRADQHGERPFAQVVMGRPVYFVDGNPEADQAAEATLAEIAHAVGFTDVSFQFEPIAAAFHYETSLAREELVLVADIGGGTSDFSLVRLSPARARKDDRRDDLLANGGVHIGGTDFDRQLSLASVMPHLGYRSQLNSAREMPSGIFFNLATWHTINFAYTRQVLAEQQRLAIDAREPEKMARLLRLIDTRAGHWLANEVEHAKIALSDSDRIDLPLDRLEAALTLSITRDEFDQATAGLVDSVESTVACLLRDAGVAAEAIDTVFFTGGSSGVPRLRQRIAALLPKARAVEGDLFGSIGAGLAVEAARRYG